MAQSQTTTEVLAALNTAFEEFKTANDGRLASIDGKFDDVVTSEKVDRINSEITTLSAQLETMNAAIQTNGLGGLGGGGNADVKAHKAAFNTWMRRGSLEVEGSLRGLEVKAALEAGSDTAGGYLVPDELEAGISDIARTVSVIRALADVRPVGSSPYQKTVNLQGLATGWVGEKETRPVTDTPTLGLLEYPVHTVYASPAATQDVLDDSLINLESWLAAEVSFEFASAEGAAFATGDGVKRPHGLAGYTTVANSSYTWGNVGFIASGAAGAFKAAASAPADPLYSLVHALDATYWPNARFIMNSLTVEAARKLKDTDGNYLWRPSLELGVPATLVGFPVHIDNNIAVIAANSLSIFFADFKRAYLIVDRIGIRVLRDALTSKPNVLFYTTKRVGGGIQNFEAIKAFKFST